MKVSGAGCVVLCLAVGMLAGCGFLKTPHKPAGFRGGYSDTKVNANTYFVSFEGNGLTSRGEVLAGWHRRAAEVCGSGRGYEIIDQHADTTSQTTYVGGGQVNATARTYGNTTHVSGTVSQPTPITITKSRAEGYIRCNDGAPPEEYAQPTADAPATNPSATQAGAWWCFAGPTRTGGELGICQPTHEECDVMRDKASGMGMLPGPTCESRAALSCFTATATSDGTPLTSCFPSAALCESERESMAASDSWSDPTACGLVGTPTSHDELALACDSGDAKACLAVATTFHQTGKYRTSLSYVAKACSAADVSACMHAAGALERGDGIDANPKKATVFYKAACKLGDDDGCEAFARLKAQVGVPPTPLQESEVDRPREHRSNQSTPMGTRSRRP